MDQGNVVLISTNVIQLDQLLKWIGLTETGGQTRFLIDAGKVQLNGCIVNERRKKIHPGDILVIDGQKYNIVQETNENNVY